MKRNYNLNFSQTITVRCDNPDVLIEMLEEWDFGQATSDITGYMGTRLLADASGQYVHGDFGIIDPDACGRRVPQQRTARDGVRPTCSHRGRASTTITTAHRTDHWRVSGRDERRRRSSSGSRSRSIRQREPRDSRPRIGRRGMSTPSGLRSCRSPASRDSRVSAVPPARAAKAVSLAKTPRRTVAHLRARLDVELTIPSRETSRARRSSRR